MLSFYKTSLVTYFLGMCVILVEIITPWYGDLIVIIIGSILVVAYHNIIVMRVWEKDLNTKTREEIIKKIEKSIPLGMHKFYLNGLLFCLGRDDLCIPYYEKMTEKKVNKILEKLKEKENDN